ncbi:hypothetical protein M378DRAFT_341356 [Amanita muscaria Koide BX008]|uniref:Uncharacterized protein n=1 Tax=Amanita muscaria (strain Koide BX008) TaxID=946122 RepID=A0A0C2SVI0_AMAMK|nr:hypothetical protein M378DRAFT_341356 [Amanita muscaria Koide BX008]
MRLLNYMLAATMFIPSVCCFIEFVLLNLRDNEASACSQIIGDGRPIIRTFHEYEP